MTIRSAAPGRPEDGVSDEEIVAGVLAGDRSLFGTLMRRYNQRIYRTVRAIVRADDEAEDVVQQAYLRAFDRLGQFRGEAAFSTWLTRIAVHEALGRMRTRNRRGDVALVEGDEVPARDPNPEEEAATRELGRVLERHIDRLPEAYRTVVVLRDVEELDTAETARCLGISEEAVRVRLHRARHMLQESLAEAMGAGAPGAFRFDGARCDRMVAGVLRALGAKTL